MKKRIFAMLLTGIFTLSVFGACGTKTDGGSASSDSSIVFAQGADPRGLDPALVDDGESSKVIVNIYEGLLKYADDSTKIEPCLAKDWKMSDDGLSYTFNLRDDVKFHDGTPFNAEAVKVNIERQTINKTDDMPYAGFVFGQVDSVVVDSEFVVTINLKAPSTPFLANIAMSMAAPMVSPKALEENGGNVNEKPVGTGCYKFVSWNKSESVVLEKNEEYWGEKAKSDKLVFRFIPDNSARVVALTNGEVDIIDGIDATVVDQIESAGAVLNKTEGMNVNYLAYNTTRLTDPEVRKALSQAVDVNSLVEGLYKGYASPATTILPSFVNGYSDTVKQIAYDADAAKATLESKKVGTLKMITYTNPRPYNTVNGKVLAEAIQGEYQKVGIDVVIESYDWTAYADKVVAGDYDICFYGWTGDNGDPDNFMNLLGDQDPSMNVARYNDKEYLDLIAEALKAPEGDERNALYTKMEQKVADEAIWLPISHSTLLSAQGKTVENFSYHMTGNVWLDQVTK